MILYLSKCYDDVIICDGESTESKEEKRGREDSWPSTSATLQDDVKGGSVCSELAPVTEVTYTQAEQTVSVLQPAVCTFVAGNRTVSVISARSRDEGSDSGIEHSEHFIQSLNRSLKVNATCPHQFKA